MRLAGVIHEQASAIQVMGPRSPKNKSTATHEASQGRKFAGSPIEI